ncbi:MAG: hypothetical protein MK078_15350 [Crocinitomicaceae bacterium]|nr:hypothetical protein [Crocinitomicaceae bacterium]
MKQLLNMIEILVLVVVVYAMFPNYSDLHSHYRWPYTDYEYLRPLQDAAIILLFLWRIYLIFIKKEPKKSIWGILVIYLILAHRDIYFAGIWYYYAGFALPILLIFLAPIFVWVLRGISRNNSTLN